MVQTTSGIDKFGLDPLTQAIFDEVDNSNSVNVLIDVSLEGNPQMVSHKRFGTNAYWRHILIANGLIHPSDLKAGMIIQIPIKRPVQPNKKIMRTTI